MLFPHWPFYLLLPEGFFHLIFLFILFSILDAFEPYFVFYLRLISNLKNQFNSFKIYLYSKIFERSLKITFSVFRPDLKTQASFVFLPQKFCGNSAKLSRKNFVNLMWLPTFYLDSWNYLRKNKYSKDKFYIQAILSVA